MKYKVAAIQERSLDTKEQCLKQACELIHQAADSGAKLVVFPEAWLPGYPSWAMKDSSWESADAKSHFRNLYENSYDPEDEDAAILGKACQDVGVFLAMGVNERTKTGTIYNSLVYIDDKGQLLGIHRKLIPTYHERMVWGRGDGSTLHVFDTTIGRLSGLICYEHLMPFSRYVIDLLRNKVKKSRFPQRE